MSSVTDPQKGDMIDGQLASDDRAALDAIGKKAVFERRFTFWTALGITVCISGTWEGICSVLIQALTLGGPVALIWGYVLCAATMTCVAASLAELSSIWPSSGAQYHWVAELSPSKARSLLSWCGGWLAFSYAWLASVSCAMGVAIQIQSYVIIARPSYADHMERWHAYVIYVVVCLLYLIFNLYGMKYVNVLNIAAMVLHVAGYFTTIILLPATTDIKHTASYVFTNFSNNSGWESNGVAFCAAIMTTMYGFGGIESAAHFAEEIQHVTRSLPRAIFWTVMINGVMVFPWIVALLYCLGDLDALLASPIATTSPITQILYNSTGSAAGSIFLSCIGSYLALVGGADSLGSSARTIWAMARDNAFPSIFSSIHPKLNVPFWTICIISVPQFFLGLIYIWNVTAFYGIISGVLALYSLSFALPIGLHLLYARRKKNITYGPWNMGPWGILVNSIALAWSVFVFIFLCFPLYQPVTPDNMNYAIVIVAVFIFLSLIIYAGYGHKRFKGPLVEIVTGSTADGLAREKTFDGPTPVFEEIKK